MPRYPAATDRAACRRCGARDPDDVRAGARLDAGDARRTPPEMPCAAEFGGEGERNPVRRDGLGRTAPRRRICIRRAGDGTPKPAALAGRARFPRNRPSRGKASRVARSVLASRSHAAKNTHSRLARFPRSRPSRGKDKPEGEVSRARLVTTRGGNAVRNERTVPQCLITDFETLSFL